ncbi:MAG TPA: NAD(P)/FAD-dependent oxidoreductase [Candidatus Corynebacterium avicola]|uniref:NAD(P)/FAD-dependent oxidoreductase n=1 Tax=Candidatus Corynebacterium avicola TaxID=2838527 RepID=A0A9D1RN04_9CORY|nr:NAD(P)/FAD-dependent oxidoreductase [Candidatus Corynebacterium avicola]
MPHRPHRPSRSPRTAVVVGSGPNGLAAAVTLAHAGVQVTVHEAATTIGGGVRSSELMVPGVVHDLCSATHPLAQAGAFLRDPDMAAALRGHGLDFAHAPVDMVHVLDDTSTDRAGAATLHTSVDATAADFPTQDARMWRSSFSPFIDRLEALADDILQPLVHLPRNPLTLAGFGTQALLPASWSWRRFRSPQARALFAGIAAHAFTPLHVPASSAAGLLLTVAGHAHGWPVAVGGSQTIADALAAELRSFDGEILTDSPVTDFSHIGDADLVLLDTSVETAASILGDRVPHRVARAWSRFRRGPAVAKVDYVIEGDVPWLHEDARRAGTIHLGGTAEQIAVAEQDCWSGRLPQRPFTLVCQQYLADPSRSTVVDGRTLNPLWAYAHVPAGWTGSAQDTFDLVTAQIERAAPGFRERVLDWRASPPAAVASHNANNVGGEISGGANDLAQLIARPRVLQPYDTGVPGVFLCSSATAPGGGVHFMCGVNAARRALSARA